MARLIFANRARADLDRLTDLLLENDAPAAAETTPLIAGALSVLEEHPLIGRPAHRGLRELVISRGRSGYLALYEFDPVLDVVFVLAIRHQREAGYREPEAD